MQIALFFPSKVKPSEITLIESIYLNRLKKYKVNIEEYRYLKAEGDLTKIKRLNDESILKKIKKNDILIVCDERGKLVKSEDMVKILKDFRDVYKINKRRLIFLIGGPYGFSDLIRKRADIICSLSGLVLASGIARMVLLEALYRSFMIIDNHPYHNE